MYINIKKSLLIFAIATGNQCYSQLTSQDLEVVKHYPPDHRKLVKPKSFVYTSRDGTVLSYEQSEADLYRTKADSLAETDNLDEVELLNVADKYTDGGLNAWIEGSLKTGKDTYFFYGSYVGEGYIQGALYDKNKRLYGMLEWESGNDITAILKTKTSTFKYDLSNNKNYPKPMPTPKNDALTAILQEQESNNVNTGKIINGQGHDENEVIKDVLYLNDLKEIEGLSNDERIRQIKKWGWIAEEKITKSEDKYIFITKSGLSTLQITISSQVVAGVNKSAYTFSNCNLAYVNQFVERVKKNGYYLVEDKKAFLRLKSNKSVITINKSILEHNQQYFTIKVE